MKQYYEHRTISAEKLDYLCTEKEWYNDGTIEEYNNLLDKVRGKQLTLAFAIEIATDICKHNDYVLYEVEDIASILIQNAETTVLLNTNEAYTELIEDAVNKSIIL